MSVEMNETKKKNKEDSTGYEYDEAVLKCFLKQQDRLFPEPVAEGMEEAKPSWRTAWRLLWIPKSGDGVF